MSRCLSLRYLFMAFLLLWSGLLSAAPLDSELAPGIALVHRTDQLKKAFLSGKADSLEKASQDVDLLRRTYGTLDLAPMVESMSIWSRALGEEGQVELGLRVLSHVEQRWASHHPALLSSRILLLRKQGFKGYIQGLPHVAELVRMRLSHPDQRWLWILQHVSWMRAMATIGLWLFALALMLRYRQVLRDIWEESFFRKGMGPIPAALVGALILSLPVLVGLDPVFMAMFWLWLLAPFMHVHEVRVTYLVLLLQLVHPAMMYLEAQADRQIEPSIRLLQLQPQAKSIFEQGTDRLNEGDRRFLEGFKQLSMRQWKEAESIFDGLTKSHPDRAQVLNNRGVARFQMGRTQEALQDFEAAFKVGGSHPEILYNQSVIAFSELDSKTGIDKQEEARRVAPEAYEVIRLASQSMTEQRTYAMYLPDTPERVQALRTSVKAKKIQVHTKPSFLVWVIVPLIALVAFVMRLRRSMRQAHPTQCIRCGDPFHTTDSPDVEVCSKCHHLFILKDGLHGANRKSKVEEIARFQRGQRWIHRTLIFLVPGADRCFMGFSRQGILGLLFFSGLIGIVLVTGRSLRYPGEILSDPPSLWVPFSLGLLALVYLRSWFKFLPSRN